MGIKEIAIHVVAEAILIGLVIIYFYKKNRALEEKIKILEEKLNAHDAVIKQMSFHVNSLYETCEMLINNSGGKGVKPILKGNRGGFNNNVKSDNSQNMSCDGDSCKIKQTTNSDLQKLKALEKVAVQDEEEDGEDEDEEEGGEEEEEDEEVKSDQQPPLPTPLEKKSKKMLSPPSFKMNKKNGVKKL
jgi:hypothetical protein